MYEDEHKTELLKLIMNAGSRYDVWRVFSDFCEMLADAISNSVDWPQRKEREADYRKLIGQYDKDTQKLFPQMAAELTAALQRCAENGSYQDILGQTFHELGVQNEWKGQFFTPQSVSDLMAEMSFGSLADFDRRVKEQGYVDVYEPACGAGSTILGFLNAYRKFKPDGGFNEFVVHAGDVDARCVHMCYIQLSLYGVAAIVEQRNALSMELAGGVWYTHLYIAHGWEWRELRGKHKAEEKEPSQTSHKTTTELSQQKENPPETEGEVEMSLF